MNFVVNEVHVHVDDDDAVDDYSDVDNKDGDGDGVVMTV